MARLLAMYKTPKDAKAFNDYYFSTHVPIAKRLPGLRKYEISKGQVMTPGGASGVHLVAILHFDDGAAIQKALGSPEGLVTASDLQNFATGGVDLFMFDDTEV
jgi:uncharacterized protein (TIGR02118 family)